jgi:transcriptional regulator with XRE-family HTH domain
VAVPRFSKIAAAQLGKNIARLRQEAGFTQDLLSERLDVTTRYLQKLERGLHTPSLALLVQIRKTLKADWSILLTGL